MKLLIFNHFFEQDIEAFSTVAKNHKLLIYQASILNGIARKYLPDFAFNSFNPQDFTRAEYVEAYKRYEKKARQILLDLYKVFAFDALIVPSDFYLYVRPWASQAHELGVPFIVLQKETTVMPLCMAENAKAIARIFPFIGDLMLVCSQRLKESCVIAGADENKIIVTGQPRFDIYKTAAKQHADAGSVGKPAERQKTILFLSYDVDISYVVGSDFVPSWLELRSETEEVLMKIARKRGFNILIKPHPQQKDIAAYKKKLRKMAGPQWKKTVHFVEEVNDIRHLIIDADIVVGFQSTGLVEALAAEKNIVYTFWTKSATQYAVDLLPFHNMGGILCVARSPQELENFLLSDDGNILNVEQANRRLKFVEEHLGFFDGHASERCLKFIENFVTDYSGHIEPDVIAFRRELEKLSPAYCKQALFRARIALCYWASVALILPVLYPAWLFARRLMRRRGKTPFIFVQRQILKHYNSNKDRIINCCSTLEELNAKK